VSGPPGHGPHHGHVRAHGRVRARARVHGHVHGRVPDRCAPLEVLVQTQPTVLSHHGAASLNLRVACLWRNQTSVSSQHHFGAAYDTNKAWHTHPKSMMSDDVGSSNMFPNLRGRKKTKQTNKATKTTKQPHSHDTTANAPVWTAQSIHPHTSTPPTVRRAVSGVGDLAPLLATGVWNQTLPWVQGCAGWNGRRRTCDSTTVRHTGVQHTHPNPQKHINSRTGHDTQRTRATQPPQQQRQQRHGIADAGTTATATHRKRLTRHMATAVGVGNL